MHITWILPTVSAVSGGIRTIVNAINGLVLNNHDCSVVLAGQTEYEAAYYKSKSKLIDEYKIEKNVNIKPSSTGTIKADCVVATHWSTAQLAMQSDAKHKVYFVQDFEPFFYPIGNDYYMAEQTYHYDMKILTIGAWLAHKLEHDYGRETDFFDFTANSAIYHPLANTKRGKSICALIQPDKPRRCTPLLLEALQIVDRIVPDLTIHLYGCSQESIDCLTSTLRDARHFINAGILTPIECNELYNSCAVGVCLSATNPSRIPFEMMRSGLPVIDLYGDNTSFDYPDDTILLAESNPAALAEAMYRVLSSRELASSLANKGLQYMLSRDSNKEYEQIIEFFSQLNTNSHNATKTIKKYKHDCVYATEHTEDIMNMIAREKLKDQLQSYCKVQKNHFGDDFKITVRIEDKLHRTDTNLTMKIAVWTTDNQSDLIWLDTMQEDSTTFSTQLHCIDFDNVAGFYHIHVYIHNTKDESMTFLVGTDYYITPKASVKNSCKESPCQHTISKDHDGVQQTNDAHTPSVKIHVDSL